MEFVIESSRKKFGEKFDSHETRGLIDPTFNPETLEEAEARIVSRTPSLSNRTPVMNFHKKTFLRICIISILFFLLLIFQYGSYFSKSSLNKLLYADNQTQAPWTADTHNLQLNLPHCRIPKVQIYSQSYEPSELVLKSCENEEKISTLKNGILQLEGFGVDTQTTCCASEVLRPYQLTSDTFQEGACIPFTTNTMKSTGKEFVKVMCTNEEQSKTRFNFFANVIPNAHYLKEKIDYWKQKKEMPVNVLVLVLDSTSRTDAFRQLPNTMSYLLDELNFIDFKGFHHLGEPTMLNAIPLLLGVPMSNFFGKIKQSWTETWDNFPFIWKEFSQSNYATAYIEDIPDVGTFNYGGQTGFTYRPVDFYLRPFLSANVINMGNRHHIMEAKKACVGNTPIEKFILNYQLEMLEKMNGIVPVFSMPWLCWPHHDFPATLFKLENATLNFFQNLKNTQGLLENTFTIVMADHSFYTGPYAQSHEGLLERRLPLFLMRLPEKLTSKYPEFEDRVKENSNRITSHYDVYKTLLHLAQLSTSDGADSILYNNEEKVERKFGESFLKFIPESRTCAEAGIPENNCACNLPPPPTIGGRSLSTSVPDIMLINKHEAYFKVTDDNVQPHN